MTLIAKITSAAALIMGALALWCWLGWSSAATQRDDARESLSRANAELALLRTDAELKDIAAGERQADQVAIAQTERELIDAIHSVPDTQPDTVRVAVGCERLRQAGYLDAHLPAVCRLGSGAEAAAAR